MSEPAAREDFDLASKINRIIDLKDQITELNDTIKTLKKEQESLELEVLSVLKYDLKVERTGTDRANAIIQHKVSYSIADREALNEFIMENNALHIMQARVSSRAVDEYIQEGIEVPGLSKYERDELVVRRR